MDKNGKRLPTQGMLLARILVGGYLVYLGISLFTGRTDSSMNVILLWMFILLFSILGAFLIIQALLNYSKGNYQGGALDTGSEEENAEAVDVQEDETVVEDVEKVAENTESIDVSDEVKIDTQSNN